MATKEVSFPRGSLTTHPKGKKDKNITLTTDTRPAPVSDSNDNLFGLKSDGKSRKERLKEDKKEKLAKLKERKKKKKTDDSDDDLGENDETLLVIEDLTASKLSVGMVLLGCIEEIYEFELRIQLVGGAYCTVPMINISKPYADLLERFTTEPEAMAGITVLKPSAMFQIGQYFPVKITSKQENQSGALEILGSVNPRDIMESMSVSQLLNAPNLIVPAAVVSIEDHGYLMDIGMKKVSAFLNSKDAKSWIQDVNNGKPPAIGQLMSCAISEVIGDRSVKLTTSTKVIEKAVIPDDVTILAKSLVPGNKVNAIITDSNSRGLEVMVLSIYKGFINRHQLADIWHNPRTNYKIADTITATVLYVHPITNAVALTLRNAPSKKLIDERHRNLQIGKIIEKASVCRKDAGGSLILRLPNGVKAIAPRNQLFDSVFTPEEFKDKLSKKFPPGTKHPCRILSINLMDSYVRVSLKKSTLNSDFISLNEINVGDFVDGKVKSTVKDGVVVKITQNIRGFIPIHHLNDQPHALNKSLNVLYPEGREVKCRVLRISKEHNPPRITLTNRTKLLNRGLNIIDSYTSAKPGLSTYGVVVLVNRHGLLVEFFGGTKGFIPMSYLSFHKVNRADEVYKPGQLVKCTVVQAHPEIEKLTLSLVPLEEKYSATADSDEETEGNKREIKVSDIIENAAIVEKKDNLLVLRSEELPHMECHLQKLHLDDNPVVAEELFDMFKVGNTLKEVYVLKKLSRKRMMVSCRLSFLQDIKENKVGPKEQPLVEGTVIHGMIIRVKPNGLIIIIANGIYGFIPLNNISDDEISDLNQEFSVGQAVLVKLVQVMAGESQKPEKKFYLFSMKESDLNARSHTKRKEREERLKVPKIKRLELKEDSFWEEDQEQEEKKDNEKESKKRHSVMNEERTTKKARIDDMEVEDDKYPTSKDQPHIQQEDHGSRIDHQEKRRKVEDFEKRLATTPHDPRIWIEYIDLHLLLARDVEAARIVAERALSIIPGHLEQQKLKVWTHFLRLENSYGTEESLDDLLQRALKYNDELKLYNNLIQIHRESGKQGAAEATYLVMLKKFKKDKSVWTSFAEFYMDTGRPEMARKLLTRALDSVDKLHHIDLLTKFAIMEFKQGDVEKGKTIFENMMTTCPKRVDLWLIYIDMMLKYGQKTAKTSDETSHQEEVSHPDQTEAIRNIFERMITLALPAKKMKTIFKRYLDFEKEYGDKDTVARVKQKALEYVETAQ